MLYRAELTFNVRVSLEKGMRDMAFSCNGNIVETTN